MCAQSPCHLGQSGPTFCQMSDPMGLFCVCISASDFWEVPNARGSMTFVGTGGSSPLHVEDFLQGPCCWASGPGRRACLPWAHLPFVKAELKVHPHRRECQPGWAPPRGPRRAVAQRLLAAWAGLSGRGSQWAVGRVGVSTVILKGFLCGWVCGLDFVLRI